MVILTENQKKLYKKWLANGDCDKIQLEFGDDFYKKAILYIAKKASEWLSLYEIGYPLAEKESTPIESQSITTNNRIKIDGIGKKRIQVPSSLDQTEVKQKKRRHLKTKQDKDTSKRLHTLKKDKSKKINVMVEPTFDNPVPLLPRCKVPYKVSHAVFSLGDQVWFILPAYAEFIESHSTLFNEDDILKARSLITSYEAITVTCITCRVTAIELLPSISDDALKIMLRSTDGQSMEVLVLKPTSQLLQTSPHIISHNAYQKSMELLRSLHQKFNGLVTSDRSLLKHKETSICQVFALPPTDRHASLQGECYEGMIYDINEDALEHPYHSIHVLWYGKSAITGKWVMDFFQCDNETSPWEISISKVAEERTEKEQIVRAPFNATFESILCLLRDDQFGPEGVSIFNDISDYVNNEKYKQKIQQPMDFCTIATKLSEHKYEQDHANEFWDDLALIVQNAKTFNQYERVEWRVADILEKTVHRIHDDIEFRRIRYNPDDEMHKPIIDEEIHELIIDDEMHEPIIDEEIHEPIIDEEIHEPIIDETKKAIKQLT